MTDSVYITEVPLRDRLPSQKIKEESSDDEFVDSDEEVKEANQHFQVD
jgi:hypothetical protein